MERISFNIGYIGSGSGILTWYPQVYEGTFSEFVKNTREQESIEILWEWSEVHHVPPSSLALMIRIENDEMYWEYTVRLINVREYRKHWELKYNKKWKGN